MSISRLAPGSSLVRLQATAAVPSCELSNGPKRSELPAAHPPAAGAAAADGPKCEVGLGYLHPSAGQ